MKQCAKPCKECPFRKDSQPGWLADYQPGDLHSLVMSEALFPCHLTHDNPLPVGDPKIGNEHPLCAGALAFMKKAGKMPRNNKLAAAVRAVDRDALENILSIPEFYTHHS